MSRLEIELLSRGHQLFAAGGQLGQYRGSVGQQNGAANAPVTGLPMPNAHVPDYEERKAAENALVVSRLKPNYPGR